MMDWSRCCNSLTGYADGVYQVGVFERELSKHHYYSAVKEGPARAIICTWEETEEWLQEEATKKAGEKHEREAVDALNSQNTDASSKIHPLQDILTKIDTDQEGIARKENGEVKSPRSPNTFPGSSLGTTNGAACHDQVQKSKTGLAKLRARVSMPQIRKLFSRKAPPIPIVQRGFENW